MGAFEGARYSAALMQHVYCVPLCLYSDNDVPVRTLYTQVTIELKNGTIVQGTITGWSGAQSESFSLMQRVCSVCARVE